MTIRVTTTVFFFYDTIRCCIGGVTIGHIVDAERGIRFQVMDTPGLLDRPIEERNEMEKLTFASMAHLPTAVMFVIDPSGLSGRCVYLYYITY
jgi:GTP1/Obg family GTP-binding protein